MQNGNLKNKENQATKVTKIPKVWDERNIEVHSLGLWQPKIILLVFQISVAFSECPKEIKVRQWWKQIVVSSILSKNDQNSLSWVKKILGIVCLVWFLEELRTPKNAFEIYWPLLASVNEWSVVFLVLRAFLISSEINTSSFYFC